MSEHAAFSHASRVMLTTAAFIVVVAGMRAAEAILVPFLLSLFIAIIAAPSLFWLQSKRIPAPLALLLVVLVVMGLGLGMAALVGTSLNDFTAALPTYQESIQAQVSVVLNWLTEHGITVPSNVIRDAFDPSAAMQLAAKILTALSGVLTNVFFILLTAIFILLEASSFPAKLRRIVKDPEASFGQFSKLTDSVKRYIVMKSWVSLLTGLVIGLWLMLIGVNHPMLWGLLAFLLNFVPNIGSIIAAVPAVLLALVQGGAGLALSAAVGYVVTNVTVGNGIEPRIMGRGLGLSTLVVFLSLVFWGWVLGPVGMLLSVPLTMVIKIALEARDDTRWLAILLGSDAAVDAKSSRVRAQDSEEIHTEVGKE